jgi:hypothetical protein
MIGNMFLNPHKEIGRKPLRTPLLADSAAESAGGGRPSKNMIAMPRSTGSIFLGRASSAQAPVKGHWWRTCRCVGWAESETKPRESR